MFEFLFGVSRDLISRGELLLMSDWPRWILVAALLSSAAVLVASLLRQRRTLTGPQLGAIGLLQLSMVAVVLLILWEPGLRTERLRAGDNVVAVMLDTSESMVLGDSRGSRMELAEPLIRDRVVPALQQEHVIQQFYFSDLSVCSGVF